MILSDIMNQSQPQPQSTSNFKKNKKPFRLVLDEPVLFIEDKPAMVRGEVIANLSHETHIQGPIEIVFEAIQIFYPWEGKLSKKKKKQLCDLAEFKKFPF